MKNRKSMRLREYDYSQNGYYFVTICAKDRKEWFGKIENGEMHLDAIGEIASNLWNEIPAHFQYICNDEFAAMPNHIHGILIVEEPIVGNAYMRSLQNRRRNQ